MPTSSPPRARAFRCPTCGASAAPRAQNPSYPFCTERCKSVDLGRWMASQYALDPSTGSLEIVDPHADEPEAARGRGDDE